jgi:hypothetical protein
MTGDVLTLAVSSRGILFAGGLFSGAGAYTANHVAMWDGLDWQILGRGIDNDYSQGKVMALAVSGNSVWVGGDFTVAGGKPSFYIARWSGAYLSVRMDAAASAGGMVQARPNPATSVAHLHYSISQPDHVRLSLYDLLGKEVAVIVDGSVEAGDHTVTLNVAGLSAGVYLCRLQTSRETATSTIVIGH